jgi:hypothetical protein
MYILYLVARRCVHTVGALLGTTIVEASMSHRSGSGSRVYCEPFWFTWVCVVGRCPSQAIKKLVSCCMCSPVICVTFEAKVLRLASVFMCGSLTSKPLFFLICPNYVVPFLFTHPTFLGHHIALEI